jgi:hypothetical protein
MDDLFEWYDQAIPGILERLALADAHYAASIRADLARDGYALIPKVVKPAAVEEVLDSFLEWQAATPQLQSLHPHISPHGIYKYGEVGQQRHAWLVRTNPDVQAIFKLLYGCDELVASMDGTCYIPGSVTRKKDSGWTHTDQSPFTKGEQCLQGLVSLTRNKTCTFTVYRGSHLLHAEYFRARVDKDPKWKNNFLLIDRDYLETIKHTHTVIPAGPGDVILWDSRVFHQNTYGVEPEERIVQYVAFMPKADARNTPAMQRKRRAYFEDGRTTTHRPFPIQVNGKQPQTYGDDAKLVDYAALPKPDLAGLETAIYKLI